MANAAENFLTGFIKGTMKKKRYGHYYVVTFNGVKFLLHHNPEKGRDGKGRDGHEKPYLMLVRDKKGNVLICEENRGFVTNHVSEHVLAKHVQYSFKLKPMEEAKLDVTEWRELDSMSIVRENLAGFQRVSFDLTLYDIDGTKYLSDTTVPLAGIKVGEWLDFRDHKEFLDPGQTFHLIRVPGNPKTVAEAREKQISPEVVDRGDLQILGHSVVVPQPGEEIKHPREVVEAVSNAYRGWERVPTAAITLGDGQPTYATYGRNTDLASRMSGAAKEREAKWVMQERKRISIVREWHQAMEEAASILEREIGITASDIRTLDNEIYVREACFVASPTDRKTVGLGDTWHKVVPFVGKR